jgi:hypothetical protein
MGTADEIGKLAELQALSGLGERLTLKERHPQESANQYLLGLIAFRK